MKKICCLTIILCLLCSCSKESKFGIEQFVSRMNKEFLTAYKTSDFMLGVDENGNNYLFIDGDNYLLSLPLNSNNDIIGVSLLCTQDYDISAAVNEFQNICCVFTENDTDTQRSILNDCGITADTIKYTDSNSIITVGKYKYTVVCNQYSITLFCDKI